MDTGGPQSVREREKREGEMQTGDRRDRHLSLSPWEVGGPGGPGGPAKLTDLVTSLKFWC